jgi:DNA-binding transcriptional LysR family regulator
VRLLVNTVAMLEYLPKMLSAFLAQHPNVDVDLEERKSPEILRAVAAGRADIGIVAGAIDAAMQHETFPFARNLLVLILPRRHPLAGKRKVAFAETLGCDYVGLGAVSALQEFVGQQAERAGRRLKVRVRLSSFDVICQMVEGGTGIAIVPEATARRWRRSMKLNVAHLTDPWVIRHLTLCVQRSIRVAARQKIAPPFETTWAVPQANYCALIAGPDPQDCRSAPHMYGRQKMGVADQEIGFFAGDSRCSAK